MYLGSGASTVKMELPVGRVSKCVIRSVILFLTAKNETASSIYRQLVEVFGENVITVQHVRKWRREFVSGRREVHDEMREGRPRDSLTSDAIAGVKALLDEDRRLTIRHLELLMKEEMCNPVSHMTIQRILHKELGFRRVCARWVPHDLNEQNKNNRMAAALDFLMRYNNEGEALLDRIVTGDETWVHHVTPSTKRQSSVWKTTDEPAPKKFKMGRSAKKVLCTAFWDAKGLIHVEYTSGAVGAATYVDTVLRLWRAIKKKRPGLLTKKVLFLHDNAPGHSAKITKAILTNLKWDVFGHPPYSPDLAPSDYHLFPNLKQALGGKRFESDEQVEMWVNEYFRKLDPSFYRRGIEKLVYRYDKCLNVFGNFIEK